MKKGEGGGGGGESRGKRKTPGLMKGAKHPILDRHCPVLGLQATPDLAQTRELLYPALKGSGKASLRSKGSCQAPFFTPEEGRPGLNPWLLTGVC